MQAISSVSQGIEHGIAVLSGIGTLPRLHLASRAKTRVQIRIGAKGCGGGAKRRLHGFYSRGDAKAIIAALVAAGVAR